jgi:hypothetical protein
MSAVDGSVFEVYQGALRRRASVSAGWLPGGGVPADGEGLAGEHERDHALDRGRSAVTGLPGAGELLRILDRDFNGPSRSVSSIMAAASGPVSVVTRARSNPVSDLSRMRMTVTGISPASHSTGPGPPTCNGSTWHPQHEPELSNRIPEALRGVREDLTDVWGSSLAQDQADAFAGAAAAVVFRLVSLDWFDLLRHVAAWDDASRQFNHVQVEERNARALAGLPSDADVVLLWDAGHLPGLAAGLKETGHWRQGTTWLNVGRLPTLWASIRTAGKYLPALR